MYVKMYEKSIFDWFFFNVVWMDPWPHLFTKRQCAMHMKKWD